MVFSTVDCGYTAYRHDREHICTTTGTHLPVVREHIVHGSIYPLPASKCFGNSSVPLSHHHMLAPLRPRGVHSNNVKEWVGVFTVIWGRYLRSCVGGWECLRREVLVLSRKRCPAACTLRGAITRNVTVHVLREGKF